MSIASTSHQTNHQVRNPHSPEEILSSFLIVNPPFFIAQRAFQPFDTASAPLDTFTTSPIMAAINNQAIESLRTRQIARFHNDGALPSQLRNRISRTNMFHALWILDEIQNRSHHEHPEALDPGSAEVPYPQAWLDPQSLLQDIQAFEESSQHHLPSWLPTLILGEVDLGLRNNMDLRIFLVPTQGANQQDISNHQGERTRLVRKIVDLALSLLRSDPSRIALGRILGQVVGEWRKSQEPHAYEALANDINMHIEMVNRFVDQIQTSCPDFILANDPALGGGEALTALRFRERQQVTPANIDPRAAATITINLQVSLKFQDPVGFYLLMLRP